MGIRRSLGLPILALVPMALPACQSSSDSAASPNGAAMDDGATTAGDVASTTDAEKEEPAGPAASSTGEPPAMSSEAAEPEPPQVETLPPVEEEPVLIEPGPVQGPASCASSCSADLRDVLDCDDEVVERCERGQACFAGGCIDDACRAAETSRSSVGCDYWALKPDTSRIGRTGCFAAFVANTWTVPVSLQVSFGDERLDSSAFIRIPRGQGAELTYEPYDAEVGLPVDEVAILFLAQEPNEAEAAPCPVTPAVSEQAAVFGTAIGQAFRIEASGPVAAYSMMPYGGGPARVAAASLLLPTGAWGEEYVAVNAYAASDIQTFPSLAILAREDDTEVELRPPVDVEPGDEVNGVLAGESATYVLNAGEYLQITQETELTGMPIAANKPVGLWGAHTCLQVPADASWCDTAHQQIPALGMLGSQYVGVRYKNRLTAGETEEQPPWRVVGVADGTMLDWGADAPVGAPTEVNAGDVVEFEHPGPLNVQSQDSEHPFYFSQYMTGGAFVAEDGFEGDPEWINVVPAAQFLKRYVFFADPTFPETSLVIVRSPGADGQFADVDLDCLGIVDGWQAVGDHEYARVELVTGAFENVGSCSTGRHEITSNQPFGVTVWGWGNDEASANVSYAYAAGAGLRTINDAPLPIPRVR